MVLGTVLLLCVLLLALLAKKNFLHRLRMTFGDFLFVCFKKKKYVDLCNKFETAFKDF